MKKNLLILLSTLVILVLVMTYYFKTLNSIKEKEKTECVTATTSLFNEIKCEVERAYFEGQKDAINGNVRIGMDINGKDTCYKWTKSCWDDTTIKVIYNPSCK